MKYFDPWKDSKFGTLKSDKKIDYCELTFSQAKIYKETDGYTVAMCITAAKSLERGYGTDSLDYPLIGTLRLYSQPIEQTVKDKSGNKVKQTYEPSKLEKAVCNYWNDVDKALGITDKTFQGHFMLLPDSLIIGDDDNFLREVVGKNFTLIETNSTGELPPYEGKKSYSNNYARTSISPQEKLDFAKQEIKASLQDDTVEGTEPLGVLLELLAHKYKDSSIVFSEYISLLSSICS